MTSRVKVRRSIAILIISLIAAIATSYLPSDDLPWNNSYQIENIPEGSALEQLENLDIKGRSPKTGYERSQFGSGWGSRGGCTTRNIILKRDLTNVELDDDCQVQKGRLDDPYTGTVIFFVRGADTSSLVQIDHVVALSNAWQTGAQQLDYKRRIQFANDPINLLAVDGSANQQKGDGDAATWLPSNKPFRCQYVARQIAIKSKYKLYVTTSEKTAMQRVLAACPDQKLPTS